MQTTNYVKSKASNASLGKNAKSSDIYKTLSSNKPTEATQKQRTQTKYRLQDSAAQLLVGTRTAKCMRHRTSNDVAVIKTSKGAHFANLQTCSSVWACPVCSAKIAVRRRDEVTKAIHEHTSVNKHQTYFLTLTFSHSRYDDLSDLVLRQRKAINYFNTSYAFKQFRINSRFTGSIRALEVKHSEKNGWHPHTHTILFTENKIDINHHSKTLFKAWFKSCEKAGLSLPNEQHGLDLKPAYAVADYITKFANEVTMSAYKDKSKTDSLAPFELLAKYTEENCKRSGALFVEYTKAFAGSRQLYWSPKLKSKLGIDEKTDEELNNESQDQELVVFKITAEDWKIILRYKLRATILNIVQFNPNSFDDYIYSLKIYRSLH